MKAKEHSKEVKVKIIEFRILEIGCEIVSKRLDIPESAVRSIVRKWKQYHITQALPRQGPPSKAGTKTRQRLVPQ